MSESERYAAGGCCAWYGLDVSRCLDADVAKSERLVLKGSALTYSV